MQDSVLPLGRDEATDKLKVPPHSVEAEQSVLGALLLENSAWDRVADIVDEKDFYARGHRLIFKAIRESAEEAVPFDAVTLAERLESSGELESVGGIAYLGSLAANTPSASNVKSYAQIVHERSVLRELIRVANEVADGAFAPEGRSVDAPLEHA